MSSADTHHIGIASSYVCEPVARWLHFWLDELGVRPTLHFAGYSQLQQELRSPVAFKGAHACLALLSFADWHRGAPFDVGRFEESLQLLCDGLEAFLACQAGRLLLVLCPAATDDAELGHALQLTLTPTSALSLETSITVAECATYESAVARLRAIAAAHPRLSLLTTSELMAWYPVPGSPFDASADALGHVPYTEPMWCALGGACARLLRPSLTPPLKAVVVDCDYTLWRHAVGEVGPEGIEVEAHHIQLQERLLALRERGVLLCLCSKNRPEAVDAALRGGRSQSAPQLARSRKVSADLGRSRAGRGCGPST